MLEMFFKTVKILAMVNNGTLHYDHDRDGTHTQLAGCEARFRNVEHTTQMKIRYENDVLSVFTDFENKNEWKECFSVDGVELPTGEIYFLKILNCIHHKFILKLYL